MNSKSDRVCTRMCSGWTWPSIDVRSVRMVKECLFLAALAENLLETHFVQCIGIWTSTGAGRKSHVIIESSYHS